jgi:hypothetical protein
MRLTVCLLSLCCFSAMALPAAAAATTTGRVIKVLPHYLDLNGLHTLSPSLYERDAYQAVLRQHPEKRSGIRFDVEWKASGKPEAPLKLRVEMRGNAKTDPAHQTVLEQEVKPGGWFGHWTSLPLTGKQYESFGDLTAWRVTLWEGDRLLSEQKSFLW